MMIITLTMIALEVDLEQSLSIELLNQAQGVAGPWVLCKDPDKTICI